MGISDGAVAQTDTVCGRKEPGMPSTTWDMGPGHGGLLSLGHGE